MTHRSSQLIIMWSGAALIAAGIIMIIPQLYIEILQMQQAIHPNMSGAKIEPGGGLQMQQAIHPNMSGGKIEPGGGLTVSTGYVGVMVLTVGAFLETVGYLATFPWKGRA
jgi:hypothetical protein